MYFWKLNELGRFGWLLCLVYVICVALRLARSNVNSSQEPSWKDNFFERCPISVGGILVLTPLIISLTGFDYFKLELYINCSHFFVVISFLLISKFQAILLKIVIPRRTTIFFIIWCFIFGLLLVYTFNVIAISSVIYLFLLPLSFIHYQKIKKNMKMTEFREDDLEDVL